MRRGHLMLVFAVEGGAAIIAWLVGWLMGRPVLDSIHWNWSGLLLGSAISLPMLLIFLICIHSSIGPLARIRRFSEEVIRPLFAPCSIVELASIAGLAGIGEEMLFRGIIQGALSQWIGLAAGLAIASALFGLVHLITPTYAVLAALLGIYLGAWYAFSGNLLVPIVAHALYDLLALVYFVRLTDNG